MRASRFSEVATKLPYPEKLFLAKKMSLGTGQYQMSQEDRAGTDRLWTSLREGRGEYGCTYERIVDHPQRAKAEFQKWNQRVKTFA